MATEAKALAILWLAIGALIALFYLLPSEVVVTADGEVTFGKPVEEPLEMGWICSAVTDSCVETDLGRVP